MADWKPISYGDLKGWHEDDHAAALSCFRMSAKGFKEQANVTRSGKPPEPELLAFASKALDLNLENITNKNARDFFEGNFIPHVCSENDGFVTAYYEPQVEASRVKSAEFSYPLYAKPDDLIRLDDGNKPSNLDPSLEWARKTENGFEEHPDRKAIDEGALAGKFLELFWLRSAIEGFYIHIQGSARLVLTDQSTVRVSYAGKTGHTYTSIGKLLVRRGIMSVDEANMFNMRAWLAEDKKRGIKLLHENQSFIFFSELKGHDPDFGPIAAAGVQLTPGRSLAVDKFIHAYGTPIFLSTEQPLPSQKKPYQRLMIAQDTGSAIVGPERGDIFIGSGEEAGILAGSVRHKTAFIALKPKA